MLPLSTWPPRKHVDMGRLLSYHNDLLLLCILASCLPATSGLFEWLKQTEHPPVDAPPLPPPEDLLPVIPVKDVQFEISTADEKFLAQAKQMELSPLDSCHHMVVAQLKTSCEGLSEEELAKLGVILFNCQAQIEGRRTYACAEQMSIKDCTSNMDSDTWNAYHIVSNRARAVCYVTRQQLFRRRAEHTVNMLMAAGASQLSAMEDLKDGQLELREMTAASLDELLKGHTSLQAQQVKVHEGQGQMESSLRDNLERLGQEKALIASGQELVAQLIQGITDRMAIVGESVQIQGSEVQDSQRAMVQDLARIRQQAQGIYQKIDDSMSGFLQYQDQTLHYYADLMSKLEHMNSTLGFMLHNLDDIQNRIEERLGLSVTAMWTCLAHGGYFVLFAVLQSFLRCAVFPRVLLLLTVPLNAAAEVNRQPALDLTSLGVLLVTLSLGHWLVGQLWVHFPSRGKPSAPLPFVTSMEPLKSCDAYPRSSTPQKKEHSCTERDLLKQEAIKSRDAPVLSPPHHHCTPEFLRRPLSAALFDHIPSRNPNVVFDTLNDSHGLANVSRSTTPTSSIGNSSLSGRQLCNSVTKAGKACKKRAQFGQDYCRVHDGSLNPHFHS
ncbi:protein brambleberry isoform X2 [Vanacampus margaritifer]